MNSCCNHWKEAELVKAILNEGTDYAIGVIYFCPECGSSLKEENGLQPPIEWIHPKWCSECFRTTKAPCGECYQRKDKPPTQFLYNEPVASFGVGLTSIKPKQENKWCECSGGVSESFTGEIPHEGLRCGTCHKPYKPAPKLPEKIDWGAEIPLGQMQITINQILDYLKTK